MVNESASLLWLWYAMGLLIRSRTTLRVTLGVSGRAVLHTSGLYSARNPDVKLYSTSIEHLAAFGLKMDPGTVDHERWV